MNRSLRSRTCPPVFSILLLTALLGGCQKKAPDAASDSPEASVGAESEDSSTNSTEEVQATDSAAETETGGGSETTAEESTTALYIDVRTKDEWDAGHLEQAVHIPHEQIGDKIGGVAGAKDQKIVLYCAAGGRAGRAKEALEQLGYTNVENGGGFEDVKAKLAGE